jgi:Tol biopolymer transport system component
VGGASAPDGSSAGAPQGNVGGDGSVIGADSVAGDGSGGLISLKGFVAYDAAPTSEQGKHIQVIAGDGSCQHALTSGAAQEKEPAFSADGMKLAFASDSSGTFQIWSMDLSSGKREQLTELADGATYPSWSPDGKSVAFVTGDNEDQYNNASAVMLVDTQTLATRQLAPSAQPPYSWSAFATSDLLLIGNQSTLIGIHTDTLEQYAVVPLNGRIPEPTSPSISPDGTHYVFSDYCDKQELFVGLVNGKTGDTCANAFKLAPNADGLRSASWGPYGYVAAETETHDIVLVPSDGSSGIRVLVATPAAERNPAFAPTTALITCPK